MLEDKVREGTISDFRQIHPETFSWHGWDHLPQERLFPLIAPFLRQQLLRAKRFMPGIYAKRLEKVIPERVRSEEDWYRIPLLTKDEEILSVSHKSGFRKAAVKDPRLLRPGDIARAAVAFGSGGSQGTATPTFVTQNDRARETQAWRRCHDYHGLTKGDVALFTYNTTHKGGQWMQESLLLHGVDCLPRRTDESPLRVLENMRAYGVNVLFTVQQPYEAMQQQAKAGGINLHNLVMASLENPKMEGILLPDSRGRKQIEFIFLGGFAIVPYALALVEDYLDNTPVATLLGSSEAIPQACSTHPGMTPAAACHHNQLHLLQGPHYVEIVKNEGDLWIPVGKGEQGLLVYTSWAREGTIWIRYAAGDVATRLLDEGECTCGLHSPVIGGVRRANVKESEDLFLYGCAAG